MSGKAREKHQPVPTGAALVGVDWRVCAILAAAVVVIYARTLYNGFVEFDDPSYIWDNPTVNRGIDLESVKAAFFSASAANWHPMTWLSHMTDWQLFGRNAAGHHAMSLSLHAINAVLLYVALVRMTRDPFASAACALLFAVHPLRVESVAWVSSRKDLMSGLFFFLTLLAYHRYTEKPTAGRYTLMLAMFALGLMSKAILVTVPFLLLLLDYWPLRRLGLDARENRLRIFASRCIEKVPLLVMSALCSVFTYLAQQSFGAVASTERFTLGIRILNAAAAYLFYVQKTFVPLGLAVIYPHPGPNVPMLHVVLGVFLLLFAGLFSIVFIRKAPYVFVGWFWFVGMLVPVIGLVQVGNQAYADRFTYLPQIGLLLVLCGSASAWIRRDPTLLATARPVVAALAGILALLSIVQAGHWKNSIRLFSHAIAVTPHNIIAMNNLGLNQMSAGQFDEAERTFRAICELLPDEPSAMNNLSTALIRQRRASEAETLIRRVLNQLPDDDVALNNLGAALLMQSRFEEAAAHFERLAGRSPKDETVYLNWALALAQLGRTEDAIRKAERALEFNPGFEKAQGLLQVLRQTTGGNHAARPASKP